MTEEKKDNTETKKEDLPSPRFDIIDKMFNEIDELLAKYDKENHLSIFEMEILILMIRKKIEHLGIMTALASPDDGDHGHGETNGEMYR